MNNTEATTTKTTKTCNIKFVLRGRTGLCAKAEGHDGRHSAYAK